MTSRIPLYDYAVVSCYPQGSHSKIHSGCLKPWIISIPIYYIFSYPTLHTYDSLIYKLGTIRD